MGRSATTFEAGNTAARKHGYRALEERGPDSLEPSQVDRLQELRVLVRTEPGRLRLREELTARVALIVEIWFSALAEEHKAGTPIWESKLTNRAFFLSELRRLLDGYPKDTGLGNSAEIVRLNELIDDSESGDRREKDNGSGG